MTDSIILVGGGGHCKSCIDVIETTGLPIGGILDKERNGNILGYKVSGTDDDVRSLAEKGHSFLICVGQIKSAAIRKRIFELVKTANGKLATVIASTAHVSTYSSIGEGSIVMHQAIINAAATIGRNCIINNKALIEHDCVVGDHTHISTGAVVNGGCKIGVGVFIGSNTVIAQGIEIGDDVIIGAGSVVVKNILVPGTYAGNPVKKIQ